MPIEFASTKAVTLSRREGEELVKLHPETSAAQVFMADASTVEATLSALKTTVETFLTGEDNANDVIDRLVELVNAIQSNKDSVDALVADKVAKADIVNDLTTGGADKVLSAEQGKALMTLIESLQTEVDGSSHTHANLEDLNRLSVVDGVVAVDGAVPQQTMMYAETLPEAVPEDLAEGGLLIVG